MIITQRDLDRIRIADEVQTYLARGGKITVLPHWVDHTKPSEESYQAACARAHARRVNKGRRGTKNQKILHHLTDEE